MKGRNVPLLRLATPLKLFTFFHSRCDICDLRRIAMPMTSRNSRTFGLRTRVRSSWSLFPRGIFGGIFAAIYIGALKIGQSWARGTEIGFICYKGIMSRNRRKSRLIRGIHLDAKKLRYLLQFMQHSGSPDGVQWTPDIPFACIPRTFENAITTGPDPKGWPLTDLVLLEMQHVLNAVASLFTGSEPNDFAYSDQGSPKMAIA
ncbi:hypothetical protein MGYG_09021 [Nannizzia gypsea CBS 118893]|uniref:Uncharacterized protein n=1 Tax=Arthroderma gypseum (strain ATCC MYA-4604 / CBS 118893) TaxID=535722 RepID=E4USZ7_ARTGP|nr:hypothetical protein MGYG_09021 [Nannizzia gypsea CBS 118893]EFR00610.1 hypothetical protein MGYG_09021 [Nannizzia gypsea CBS 118893]